ncbi:MAG TPA: exodeoxyribonuclease VII large subunit, partial [Lachnospiraceae bacterium]|nr:exodeoxyribonuclease VII large subunit [Lachnospiraceae bacterium]
MKSVYSVGQINSYIKNMFSQDFMLRSIYVKGEVSNVKYHSSGHIYFTMKDKSGTIACVMFAGYRKGLDFTLKEGQQVIAGGSIEVYERDGRYQLYAKELIRDGAGLLYERFEELKKELEEMGMFSAQYKKPIPKYAKKIGIVTAPTGAAVRDIINVAKRRNPFVQLILYPALVQGDGAKESIVNGIHALELAGVDVIIAGRGGGSIEDLWAFNEEIVARAIFECSIPIVSAVGHETDTTIADFVSDMRAPTPSAAAELTVFSYEDFTRRCLDGRAMLRHGFDRRLTEQKKLYEQRQLRLSLVSPQRRIHEKRMHCAGLTERLEKRMQDLLIYKKHRLQLQIERMKALSPLERLQNGYA